MDLFLVPIRHYGEGNYEISMVKEIIATEEYLGLDEKIRQCHNKELIDDCKIRQLHNYVKENCKCNCVLCSDNESQFHL